MTRKSSYLLRYVPFCIFCLWFSLSSLSLVSVVFDFNVSLNDIAPVFPISFAVDEKGRVNCRWMIFLCVLFLLSSLPRLSLLSVVFDFNASLNDVAPVSPM